MMIQSALCELLANLWISLDVEDLTPTVSYTHERFLRRDDVSSKQWLDFCRTMSMYTV